MKTISLSAQKKVEFQKASGRSFLNFKRLILPKRKLYRTSVAIQTNKIESRC